MSCLAVLDVVITQTHAAAGANRPFAKRAYIPPKDPGGADALAKKGRIASEYGEFWRKGLRLGTGQCKVKQYNRRLMQLIHAGKAQPSFIVSHELPLEEAPEISTSAMTAGPRWC